MTATAINDVATITEAINDMRAMRATHDEWVRHLASGCADCTPEELAVAGDREHHLNCIAKYDRVLSILTARRNALRSRARRSVPPDSGSQHE